MDSARIAIVQSMDGYLTVCGPNDWRDADHAGAMESAICWHIEAGHLPAACYWADVPLPPLPTIPELRAMVEVGQFPASFVEDMDRSLGRRPSSQMRMESKMGTLVELRAVAPRMGSKFVDKTAEAIHAHLASYGSEVFRALVDRRDFSEADLSDSVAKGARRKAG